MPDKAEIVNELRKRRGELTSRFGVKRIGLFGSCVRGEAAQDSDIDILVEFAQPTFDHYMELKFLLEGLFGTPVDLVSSDAVKPRLRRYIDRDITYA